MAWSFNGDEHVAWALTMALPIVGGVAYVRTGVVKWWLGGVLMGGAYMVCAREVNRPRTKVHGYELATEASLFLIATQLRKVFVQRFPTSFLLVGLGGIGASYYGTKYYNAVLKGEHVRRFERQK